MISIDSINRFSTASLPLQKDPVPAASIDTQNEVLRRDIQASTTLVDTFLMNQLPEGPVNEMSDILRHMEAAALQSAELEQTFENLELLQAGIAEDISTLKTVLDEFSQDDLKLLAAVFQNQAVIGPANFDTNQSGFNSGFFENQGAGDFLDNLLRLDIISQSGLLEALDLTGNIINILSLRNSGTAFLESLLDILTDSGFGFPDSESPEPGPETATTQQTTGIADRPEEVSLTPERLNAKPLTIIDLAG